MSRTITDHYADDGTNALRVGSVILSHGEALLAQTGGTFADPDESTWDYWELELPITVIHEPEEGATLDASHSNPRIITTAEELDALPAGSVVRTSGVEDQSEPRVAVKAGFWMNESEWEVADTEYFCLDSGELDDLPATVLWEPSQP